MVNRTRATAVLTRRENEEIDQTFFNAKSSQHMNSKSPFLKMGRLLREKRVQGRPHRRKERRGRNARGMRVPYVPINVQVFTNPQKNIDELNFYLVCLQSELLLMGSFFSGSINDQIHLMGGN
ncbi:hypothetical protein BS1321_24865 [Peribacillus simplex NBRC 15720 = DSM 1321]|uniref:Uncharacterized protein n=1 Tax=Peribacillus simplex NBRC 15720 = DSM 1321 TaxID=1349754 RepID=A0A223ENQ5_9BACI|nr:hypothetical protein BS1321_24865 [Peribacillus simplex NBRC 15720 = DSM 1321]